MPSPGFELLDPRIQRWIWSKGWTALRDAQERAVEPILKGHDDVILAAPTAAGKTEAAFLPILTRLLQGGEELGLAIYISPLKALINDQWGRLDELCETLEIPVYPWHGEISNARKEAFRRRPRGVLLITPESIEAMFVRRGSQVPRLVAETTHIVVDELHSFIGSDRGKQCQSLLARLELATQRRLMRVGLSATLGDMRMAADFLRPGQADRVNVIESREGRQEIRVQIRGYTSGRTLLEEAVNEGAGDGGALHQVSDHLYGQLRGTNNLVFPNSRAMVEVLTDRLRRRCEADGLPVEFWPHHGSLSCEIRLDTEEALKAGTRPATAVCTNTLELGIDIGAVRSIAQVGCAPSVAALRQRLGRSGRRAGEPAILRGYVIEAPLKQSSPLSDLLREGLVQSIAMVRLLLRGWFEPPLANGLHLSTLVQQVLSTIAERGGIHPQDAYTELVTRGAFPFITAGQFADLLRELGRHDLIHQDRTRLLLLGTHGERLVEHYDFYASFIASEEWSVIAGGRTMGSLPIDSPLHVGMRIIFGGRRWQIATIEPSSRTIQVVADPGGLPPRFEATGHAPIHEVVRREMRDVLAGDDAIPFLDTGAAGLLQEARSNFRALGLERRPVLRTGSGVAMLPWGGDTAHNALALLLHARGIEICDNGGMVVEVDGADEATVLRVLLEIGQQEERDLLALLNDVENMRQAKWDWALPDELVRLSYASTHLSLTDAKRCARYLAT